MKPLPYPKTFVTEPDSVVMDQLLLTSYQNNITNISVEHSFVPISSQEIQLAECDEKLFAEIHRWLGRGMATIWSQTFPIAFYCATLLWSAGSPSAMEDLVLPLRHYRMLSGNSGGEKLYRSLLSSFHWISMARTITWYQRTAHLVSKPTFFWIITGRGRKFPPR